MGEQNVRSVGEQDVCCFCLRAGVARRLDALSEAHRPSLRAAVPASEEEARAVKRRGLEGWFWEQEGVEEEESMEEEEQESMEDEEEKAMEE